MKFKASNKGKKVQKMAGDNEMLVRLIQVAQDDKEMAATLCAILKQTTFHRKSLLNTLIHNMTLKSAPEHFIEAFKLLLDDDIAQKALELIDVGKA